MDELVSTEWLADHLDDPDLRIFDTTVILEPNDGGGFRAVSGRARWEGAHIPGSGFADLVGDLSDPDSPLRFTLPSAERFAAAMGRLGVGESHRVVLYDSRMNMWAARLWWMLRAFGFDAAAVLDGGWKAWTSEDRPTSTTPSPYPPARFPARPRDGLFVGRDQVLAAVEGDGSCIVNALTAAQHRGETNDYGRPGHLPGATNVAAMDLVDPATQRYLPLDELSRRFREALTGKDGRVITYCGGGIAASSDAFVLHRLGRRDVAVYDGSLQEWAADPSLPLVTGG